MVHKVMAFKHIKVSNKRTKSSVFHDTGRIMESNCNNRDTGQNVKKKILVWLVKHWTHLPRNSQNLHHWKFLQKKLEKIWPDLG